MEKKIAYNVKRKKRQELAQAVGEALKTAPVYKKAPSYAYEIGDWVVDRQGTLLIGSSLDSETVSRLIAHLVSVEHVTQKRKDCSFSYSP